MKVVKYDQLDTMELSETSFLHNPINQTKNEKFKMNFIIM